MRAPDPATPDVATPHPVLDRPPYVVLVAISAVGPLALNIFVPSMPGLQSEFGVSYGRVQLTLTLYIIGMALCQLVYGPLSDRFGRRPVLLAGMALFVVASILAALATSITVLIAARLLQAIGGASGLVLSRAIVRDLYDRDRSASVLGYITMAFVVAPMLAPTVGGLLDQIAGWRSIFVLLALLGAAALAATWRKLPETNRNLAPSIRIAGLAAGYLTLLRSPSFLAYAFTLGFSSAVFFAFIAGAPYVMVVVLERTAAGLRPVVHVRVARLHAGELPLRALFAGARHRPHGDDRQCHHPGRLPCRPHGCAHRGGLAGNAVCADAVCRAGQRPHHSQCHRWARSASMPPWPAPRRGLRASCRWASGPSSAQLVGILQDAAPFAVFWIMAGRATLAALTHRLALRARAT
jgi:multidrug resistance protein